MAKFAPDRSGNPAGTGKAAKLAAAIADDLADIIAALVREAKAGNTPAAALLLAHCIPPLKQTGQPVRLAFPPDASLGDKANAMVDAAAAGQLAPDVGAQLVAALDLRGRGAATTALDMNNFHCENTQHEYFS